MSVQFKSSSVNDLSQDGDNVVGSSSSGLFNSTFRRLSSRSTSMPSVFGGTDSGMMCTSDFDFSVGNLSETLPTTKEMSDEFLNEEEDDSNDDSRDEDDYYDETSNTPSHTQQVYYYHLFQILYIPRAGKKRVK